MKGLKIDRAGKGLPNYKHLKQHYNGFYSNSLDILYSFVGIVFYDFSDFFCNQKPQETTQDAFRLAGGIRSAVCSFCFGDSIRFLQRPNYWIPTGVRKVSCCIRPRLHRTEIALWSRLILFGTLTCSTALAASFSYYYDPLNRLTNAAYSDGSRESYSYDAAGNRLSRVTLAATGLVDVTPPSVPTNLVSTASMPSQLSIAWNRAFDTGGSGLAGYQIYVNGSLVATTTSTNYSLSGLSPSTQYCLTVAAVDHDGNVSLVSQPICIITGTGSTNSLTVSANNLFRAYGMTNPQLTVSYTGFVNDDTTNVFSGIPSVTTSAATYSPVGTYTIVVTNGTLSATDYVFNFVNGTLTVTGAVLTANIGITANNKVYDGTTVATISSNNVILSGVVASDTVSLVTNGYTATFASAGVGNGIGVTVGGLALTGTSATNYTLTQPMGLTANITPKAITTASVPTPAITSIRLTNGVVTIAWNSVAGGIYRMQYINNLIGPGWTDLLPDVTATGLTANQNNVVNSAPQRFYRVRVLNSGITANNKVYDGTTVATINSNSVVLVGVVGGDMVGLSTNGYMASFASPNVGTGIIVTVSGLTLMGASATNYTFTPPAGVTANITPATLTVNAVNKIRTYGLTNSLTANYSGFVNSEGTNVLTGAPSLSMSATTNSPPGTYSITVGPGTLSAANYVFVFSSGTLTVVALPQLSGVALNGNQFIFYLPTIAGQTYQLQYKDNLTAATWNLLGDPMTGMGNPLIVTNNIISSPHRYFRIQMN